MNTAATLEDMDESGPQRSIDWNRSEMRAIGRVPRSVAKKLDVIPISLQHSTLYIGAVQDSDRIKDAVRAATTGIETVIARKMSLAEVKQRIDIAYPSEGAPELNDFLEGPIKTKVQDIIAKAVSLGASDILLTPQFGKGEIEITIEGALTEHPYHQPHAIHTDTTGKSEYQQVTQTELAQMVRVMLADGGIVDPTNSRIGHTGQAKYMVDGRAIEIRIEAMPTNHGLALVGRIMGSHSHIRLPEETGMSKSMRRRFEQLMRLPDKLILFTGPIGHGKTSSLYTWIQATHDRTKKYRSAEQPVEIDLPFVAQTPIIENGPMTFADAGRRFVRMITEVIIYGELRDEPTVASAVRSSYIGHLVAATLHASDVVEAIMRLKLMGGSPYEVALALRAIVCQRIAFRSCQACTEDVEVPEHLKPYVAAYNKRYGKLPTMRTPTGLVNGQDCLKCKGRGFVGRIGIFELLHINGGVQKAIIDGEVPDEIVKHDPLYRPMIEDAIDKIFAGLTTEEYVRRVLPWTIELDRDEADGEDEVQ